MNLVCSTDKFVSPGALVLLCVGRTFSTVLLYGSDAALLARAGGVPKRVRNTTGITIVDESVGYRMQIKAFTDNDGAGLQRAYARLMPLVG